MVILNLLIAAFLAVIGLFETDGGDGGGEPDKGKPDGGSDDDIDDGGEPDKGADPAAEVAKWKALARKHEAQAKANAKAATRLKELEDAGKSEIEKANDAASTEKRRADEAEMKLLRMEVAIEKGLSPAQAKRLVGTTREELEADANELLEAFTKEGGETRTKPATGLRSRSVPGAEPEETDPHKLAAQVPRI